MASGSAARISRSRAGARLGIGHVVDDDHVGARLQQRRRRRVAAVDEADDVEARGLAERQADAVRGDRAVRHDHEALHDATLAWPGGARVKTASLPGQGPGITPAPLMGAPPPRGAPAIRAGAP